MTSDAVTSASKKAADRRCSATASSRRRGGGQHSRAGAAECAGRHTSASASASSPCLAARAPSASPSSSHVVGESHGGAAGGIALQSIGGTAQQHPLRGRCEAASAFGASCEASASGAGCQLTRFASKGKLVRNFLRSSTSSHCVTHRWSFTRMPTRMSVTKVLSLVVHQKTDQNVGYKS